MAKRIDVTLDILTQESIEFTNDPADANKVIHRIQDDEVKEITRLQMVVEPSATVETVPLPDACANYIAIYSDQTVNLTINGSDTPFDLIPKTPSKKTPVFYAKSNFISLCVGNLGSSDANVDIILAKKI